MTHESAIHGAETYDNGRKRPTTDSPNECAAGEKGAGRRTRRGKTFDFQRGGGRDAVRCRAHRG